MIGFDVIDNWWDMKLKAMNKDKVGWKPSHYPNSFLLLLLGYAKVYFHLPFRQTQKEVLHKRGHVKAKLPSILNYITINIEG